MHCTDVQNEKLIFLDIHLLYMCVCMYVCIYIFSTMKITLILSMVGIKVNQIHPLPTERQIQERGKQKCKQLPLDSYFPTIRPVFEYQDHTSRENKSPTLYSGNALCVENEYIMCCSFENTTVSIVFYTKIKLDKTPKRMKIAHNACSNQLTLFRHIEFIKRIKHIFARQMKH